MEYRLKTTLAFRNFGRIANVNSFLAFIEARNNWIRTVREAKRDSFTWTNIFRCTRPRVLGLN